MKSTYLKKDVEILLTDLTEKVQPITICEKKQMIKNNMDVTEVITEEFPISREYFELSKKMTPIYAKQTAIAVGNLAEQLYQVYKKNLVIITLLRAGTLTGILIKRYLKNKYNVDIYHYSISVPGENSLNEIIYILKKHDAKNVQFVDGWTGKGTTKNKLEFLEKRFDNLKIDLAVASDSINISKFCGIREDIAIPQSPFNACCTGLVSMPININKYLGKGDFKGAIYLKELENMDITNWYLNLIEENFDYKICNCQNYNENPVYGEECNEICEKYNIEISKLNPGINEAARALLRRDVKKLLVKDENDFQIMQIKEIAKLKKIDIEEYDFKYYKAATIAND